jgi:sterol desaturase/sphingolipid hydroxylase (fatty acid hydroxylase superfamily)
VDYLISKSRLEPIFTFKKKPNQKRKEIINSFYSSIIFGIGMWFLYRLWQLELLDLADNSYSVIYHLFSIFAALIIHETYYYWLHRAMHLKPIYKYIHHGHHDSIQVSTWTAFSFDFLETLLQVFAFYIIAFTVPLHIYSILFLLILMSLSATINHLNYEVYPKFFRTTFPFNQLIGAKHHALHHKEFKTNYGLYFTFWDKWMKTQSKHY